MADIKISELERVQSLNNGDLVEVSQEDSYSETGYSSKSAKMTDLGEKVVNGIEYTSELNTSNKKIIGAINEIASCTPVYGNTASGAIATFDTSLALPLQNCTIGINTNTGVSGANVYVKGANLWDEDWENGSISSSTGEDTTGTGIRAKNYIPVKEDVIYYPCLNAEIQTNATNIQVRFYDANKNYIGSDNYWGKTVLWNSNTSERTLRVPVGARFMRFALQPVYGSTYSDSNRISINYPATDTAYHAYNVNSTNTAISWSDLGTVSEGSLNVTMGKLTVVTGSMASGDYQITPIPINQLSGTNKIFCDTGNTSVVYACSLKDYIDSQ